MSNLSSSNQPTQAEQPTPLNPQGYSAYSRTNRTSPPNTKTLVESG